MADHTNVPTRTAQSSDIVTRLREHPVELLRCDCVRCEAADEIERLRDKVQDLRMHAEQDACKIERLRAACAMAQEFIYHRDVCAFTYRIGDCDCGYRTVWKALEACRG